MAESEKPRDMFDIALQGLRPGLKVVGTVTEEVAKSIAPTVKILTGEVVGKVITRPLKRIR